MKPIKMRPAFRHGTDTPWGGDGLKTRFGIDIPDERTGEALVVSAIPGLCSRDDSGTPLDALIAQYGAELTGARYASEFPLLLKLLDARDRLSVQVHPGDAYAREHEGKLGKSEAWVVLHAQHGARIVYGVQKGVTKEQLQAASREGRAVEGLLRFVPARAGDVFYIPSGTVHAILEGLTLYEIQQSSDVTYRFYDWDRQDARGNKRPLHIQKAVDVTDTALRMDAAVPKRLDDCRESLLDTEHFALERWTGAKDARVTPRNGAFGIITALAPATLLSGGEALALSPGESALLPVALDNTLLTCPGACLMAYPA